MEICNNRYRILKELKSNNTVINIFIAEDLWKPDRGQVELKLIDMDYVDKRIIRFIKNKFFTIKNQNNSIFLKTYEFTKLFNIDGNNTNKKKYVYISEREKSALDLLEFLQEADFSKILESIILICKILNFSISFKIAYKNINLKNATVIKNKDSYNIKIKDIISSKLFDSEHIIEVPDEDIKDFEYSNNILKDFFLSILAKKQLRETSIKTIKKIKADYKKIKLSKKDEDILSCILDICNKLETNKKELYPITQIVQDINEKLHKQFSILDIDYTTQSKLEPYISRKSNEKSEIFSFFEKIHSGKETKKTLFIDGQMGAGKTKFLNELSFLFSLEDCIVYNIPDLAEFDDESFILYVIQNIILKTNNINKDEKDILEAAEFIRTEKDNPNLIYKLNNIKHKLANRIANSILQTTEKNFLVFIIDDIHHASNFITDILLYLITESYQKSNFMLIFSYDKLEVKKNPHSKRFIKILNTENQIVSIELKNLTKNETYILIACILGTKKIPESFINNIYNHTDGNPLFISEIVKELIYNKDIQKNFINGSYIFSKKLLESSWAIKISPSIENSIQNHLNKLKKYDIKLLEAMSVFKNVFNIKILFNILSIDKEIITKSFSYLAKNKIIKESMKNKNNEYAISNNILKQSIYKKLTPQYKIEMHKKILNLLEIQTHINPSEFIWHAERAKLHNKAVQYALKNITHIEIAYHPDTVITIFKQVFTLVNKQDTNTKLEILLNIIRNQLAILNMEGAKTTMQQAELIISNNDNIKKEILAAFSVKKIVLESELNIDISKRRRSVEKAEKIINKADDTLSKLRFLNAKSIFLQDAGDVKKGIQTANKVISMSSNNESFQEEKAKALFNIGTIYYSNSEYKKAEISYLEAAKIAKKIKSTKIADACNNNLAIIFGKLRHDFKTALAYYDEVIKNNTGFTSSSFQILAILNSAKTNIFIGEYEKAYEQTLSAIKKITKSTSSGRIIFAYNTIYEILFILRRIDEALVYKNKIKKLFKDKNTIKKEIYYTKYYNISASISGFLGNYKKEEEYLKKALATNLSKFPVHEHFMKLLLETNKLISGTTNTTKKLIALHDELNTNTSLHNRRHTYYYGMLGSTRKLIMSCPNIKINKFLNFLVDFNLQSMSNHTNASRLFFKSFIDSKNEEQHLTKAYELIEDSFAYDLKIDIKTRLGFYYLKKNNFHMAISTFIESQYLIKKITKNIPNKNKVSFFKNYKYARPFIIVRDYLKSNLKDDYIHFNYVVTKKKVDNFLNTNMLELLQDNKNFIAESVNEKLKKRGLTTKALKNIINNFTEDFFENIKLLARYLGFNLLASYYDILLQDTEGTLFSIFNFEEKKQARIIKLEEIIEALKEKNYELAQKKNDDKNHLILPIYYYDEIQKKTVLLSYIIYGSREILNNFGKNGEDLFKRLRPLFLFLLKSHKFQLEASTDKLTKTLSRKYIEINFKDLLISSKKNKEKFSILIYDLDDFKKVNDRFGHQIGDIVLSKTAETAQRILTTKRKIGRFGGEEFIVLLPDTTQKDTFLFAEKVRKSIEKLKFDIPQLKISVSIGAACFPKDGDTMNELFLKADDALYHAKNNGKNQVCFWDESIKINNKKDTNLTGIISGNAIEDKQKISLLIENIQMIKRPVTKSKKIQFALENIIKLSDADKGKFITVQNNKIAKIKKNKSNDIIFNNNLIATVLKSKKSLYQIDWDNIAKKNKITGIPTWNSIIIAPVIKSEQIKAILYLTVPIQRKEFTIKEFNLVNILIKSIAPYF